MLWRTGRPVWFALAPAIFMLATTGTALTLNLVAFTRAYVSKHVAADLVNALVAGVLMVLGALVVIEAVRVFLVSRRAVVPVASRAS